MTSKKKVIVSIVILLIVFVGGFLYLNNKNKEKIKGTSISGYILGKGIAPDLTQEEIEALLQKEIDASKVAFSLYSEPTFKGKRGTIMFANPKYSAHNIELTVTLGGETIIRTDKISPDQYIEEIELIGKALKKGEHRANAFIRAYSSETDEVVGEVSVEMIIKSE